MQTQLSNLYTHLLNISHIGDIGLANVGRTRSQVSLQPSGVEGQATPFIHILLLSTIVFFLRHETLEMPPSRAPPPYRVSSASLVR